MSSLLYNSLVDNDVVDSDNGLNQQSMHGLIIHGSLSAVVEVVVNRSECRDRSKGKKRWRHVASSTWNHALIVKKL